MVKKNNKRKTLKRKKIIKTIKKLVVLHLLLVKN